MEAWMGVAPNSNDGSVPNQHVRVEGFPKVKMASSTLRLTNQQNRKHTVVHCT